MGGYGSGRWHWHKKKITVGECKSFSVTDLTLSGFLEDNVTRTGYLTWTQPITGEIIAKIGVKLDTSNISASWLRLDYIIINNNLSDLIILEKVKCNLGGTRWYMFCPICREKRVLKLFLPPAEMRFGCRKCHDLTYLSSQESDKRVSKLRKMPPYFLWKEIANGAISPLLGLKVFSQY